MISRGTCGGLESLLQAIFGCIPTSAMTKVIGDASVSITPHPGAVTHYALSLDRGKLLVRAHAQPPVSHLETEGQLPVRLLLWPDRERDGRLTCTGDMTSVLYLVRGDATSPWNVMEVTEQK